MSRHARRIPWVNALPSLSRFRRVSRVNETMLGLRNDYGKPRQILLRGIFVDACVSARLLLSFITMGHGMRQNRTCQALSAWGHKRVTGKRPSSLASWQNQYGDQRFLSA